MSNFAFINIIPQTGIGSIYVNTVIVILILSEYQKIKHSNFVFHNEIFLAIGLRTANSQEHKKHSRSNKTPKSRLFVNNKLPNSAAEVQRHSFEFSSPMVRVQLLPIFIAAILLDPTRIGRVSPHEESGEWHCDSGSGIRVHAEFRPGIITVDGKADDWRDVDGSDFPLLPALDPDADKEYNAGKMTLKAVHDGKEAYFMLQVSGKYTYSEGESTKCASVALMFQIGENATYHRMGGCEEGTNTCTNKTCRGHEVDIMHFSLGNAIPGRLYGGNPVDNRQGYGGDRFGHLMDLYAWNPHCRFLDGLGPSGNDTTAQNDWQGSWWHSSFSDHTAYIKDDSPYASEGREGSYYFEFSRPLRTMDSLQQDAQFTIGESSKLSAAFWYPEDGKPWHGSAHYSISCDWIILDFVPGGAKLESAERSQWDAATAFSLLFSVAALCISVFVGHQISRSRTAHFIPMENL